MAILLESRTLPIAKGKRQEKCPSIVSAGNESRDITDKEDWESMLRSPFVNCPQKILSCYAFKLAIAQFPPLVSINDLSVLQLMEKSNQPLSSIIFKLVAARLRQQAKKFNFHQSPLILSGTGLGLVLLIGGIYVLSRPCSLAWCQPLFEAEQLAADASRVFRSASASDASILTARERLERAMTLVKRIPPWSKYRDRANFFVSDYQEPLENLATMAKALEIESRAIALADDSPLSFAQLDNIRPLWIAAIAELKKIPQSSQAYSLAQTKLESYQQQVDRLDRKLAAEQKATVSLEAAKQSARVAKMRFNNAQSLDDWQAVDLAWQTAIQKLKDVEPKTTAYQESQKLLEIYLPQSIAVGKRKQQEESATNLYQKALEQAQLARRSQEQKAWANAVSHWRNALLYVKQITPNTFQYAQAQPLVAFYSLAFDRAQTQLKSEQELEQVRRELDDICSGKSQSCSYSVAETVIQLRLTPSYLQQLWQTALQAKAEGNLQTQIELLNHLSRLEQILQNLSNQTKKKIEVYNSEGALMMSYQPQ